MEKRDEYYKGHDKIKQIKEKRLTFKEIKMKKVYNNLDESSRIMNWINSKVRNELIIKCKRIDNKQKSSYQTLT